MDRVKLVQPRGFGAVLGKELCRLDTYAITGYFVDKNGDAYIDIFSCKEFDPDLAMKIVERFYNPKKITPTFLKRQA